MGLWGYVKDLMRGLSPYDGGDSDRQNSGWMPIDGTGEAINRLNRDLTRTRARDLERNSDTVCALIDAFERNVVGSGIRLQAKVMEGEEENEKLNGEIESLWEEWCNYKNCDISGQYCFAEMQRMAVRRKLVDGGLFFLLCTDRNAKIPLRLQMKEVDELDTSILEYGKNKVVSGVEVSPIGLPIAYHFREYDTYGWTGKSIRVEAENVVYICNKMRPSEVREISTLARILNRLRDLNQYIQAVSMKERVNACLSVFITRQNKGTGIGRPDAQQHKKPLVRKLSPAMITELDPGDEVTVVNPSGQASDAEQFVALLVRSIGAALGLSYESVSRDMSKVNYSSARQGLIDDNKTYKTWQHYLVEHLCKPIYERFLDYAVLSGTLNIPDYFENRQKYTRCVFIPGGMSWIDPLKEVRANEFAVASCQTTLEEICASMGRDYRDVLRQRAKEKTLMQKYGLEVQKQNVGEKPDGGKSKSDGDESKPNDAPKKQGNG